MNSNEVLQKDVQEAIKWEPLLHAAEIGVTAQDGVVTLSGTVDSYIKKSEAEHATKNVPGVKAIVEDINVKFVLSDIKDDTDIAIEALNNLSSSWAVPKDKVKIKVENGWVTLEGIVFWNYEKQGAYQAVRGVSGVTGITNRILIKSGSHDEIEKRRIEDALSRCSSLNGLDIRVKVAGHSVTLSGHVHFLFQKDEAERVAWNAPGVWNVDNELGVQYKVQKWLGEINF